MQLLGSKIINIISIVTRQQTVPLKSSSRGAAGRWREINGLPRRFASPSPLADNPEWSYVDGRGAAPLNEGQKKRYLRDRRFSKDIIKFMRQQKTAKSMIFDDSAQITKE
jgi:hypothetical protein